MARIQQKSSGRRVKREKLDAANVRSALKTAIEKHGITLPRFGSLNPQDPGKNRLPSAN